MPGFDGTGPRGMGPMTGGRRGPCGPFRMSSGWRGFGWRAFGMRGRAGYGYPVGVVPTREQELDLLKNKAEALKRTLEEIDARIRELAGAAK